MLKEGRLSHHHSLEPNVTAYLSNLDKNQNFDLDNNSYPSNPFKPTNSVDTYISIEANTNPLINTNAKTNHKEPAIHPKTQNKTLKSKTNKQIAQKDYVREQNQNKRIDSRSNSTEDKENLNSNRNLSLEVHNKQYSIDMKSKNNQSPFSKNPTQSYADQYYASFPTAYKLPRGGLLPLVDPYTGAILPFMNPYVPPMFPTYGFPNSYNPYLKNSSFYAKKTSPRELSNALPYNSVHPQNFWPRPNFYDQDPSIHELLYMDKFKNQEGSYTNKHIEKKIREVDGFFNPYGEYTVKDYKSLKSNFGPINPNEEKTEKMERMQKAKEVGNNFMKKKIKKSNTHPDVDQRSNRSNDKLVQSDTELPNINRMKRIQQMNVRSNPYLNQGNNYESFDFISSNDGYGNQDFDPYKSHPYNQEQNLNPSFNLGYQNENESNTQRPAAKYFKNPKFDFSKNSNPANSNENPRMRALKYAKERNL